MIEVSTNPTWLPKVLKKWPLGSKIWIRWLYLDKTSLIQSPKEVENFVGHLSAMMNCPILLTATPARQSNSPSPLPYPPNQNLVKCLSNICVFVDKYHHKNSPNQNLVTDFPNIFILIFITHLFCPSSSNIWTLWLDESATTTVLSGPTAIPATNQITLEIT